MRPGDTIGGRFLLEYLAGAGGMGQVFRALDQQSGNHVAIKALSGHHGDGALRFAREARILADLNHPQIVRHIAHGALPSGEPYLVMEWLSGEDLAARLANKGRLSAQDAVNLGAGIANALGFAHSNGIVHRDLKPSNIYLVNGSLDSIKLLDFGIAQFDRATRMTKTGKLMGTPAYMAPEQARGEARLDARADIFSLGCVLFECLVGEPAFTGVHLMAVLARILFDEPPSAREKLHSVPPALSALVARMMAKNPEERPADGGSVARMLDALLNKKIPNSNAHAAVEGPRSKSLTSSEQCAVAAILLSTPGQNVHDASTLRETLNDSVNSTKTLRRHAEQHGAELEPLLDGSMAVVLMGTSVVTDLAARAARCALAMHEHRSGRAIAIAIGRGERTGRLPMGPAIDRAARLMDGLGQTDDGCPILLDERMAGLLDARFDVRECDAAFTLHGERELAVGTRTLLGIATPCVGRERELRSLAEYFNECVEERLPSAVLVTADPGCGKSRLVHEFLSTIKVRAESASIWIGRGDPLRAGSAFALLGQALRGACGIGDGESLALRRARLSAKVQEMVVDREQQRVVEFLGELLGVPLPDAEQSVPFRAARRDPQLMFEQMREAFLTFLSAACEAGPVLILLEDLHWGDRSTVQFLDRALRELEALPLFVLAAARPEVHNVFPKLWAGRRVQVIALKELSRKAIERLARHVLGDGADNDTLDHLVRLSEGNAFYLEELIRRAAEGRDADLSETLVAMVQSRLLGLGDDARRTLRAASVFGEVFCAGGVASLLGDGANEAWTQKILQELLENEMIVQRGEGRFPGQKDLAFRHTLLREAAYTMLTDQDQSLGHRLAGEWLELHGEQDMLVLAEHFERGGDGARAGYCYLRGAEQANWGGDAAGAMAHGRRGIACRVEEPLRIRLMGAICEGANWHVEALAAIAPIADELVRVAEQGSVPWLQGIGAKLHCDALAGNMETFTTTLELLQDAPFTPATAMRKTQSLILGTYLLDNAGRIDHANKLLDQIATIAHSAGDREPLTLTLWHTICALRTASSKKDPWSGLNHGRAALRLATAVWHPRLTGLSQVYLGMNQWFVGATAEAEKTLCSILLPDEELGFGLSMRYASLAWLFMDQRALVKAKRWAMYLVDAGVTRGVRVFEAVGRWVLGEVLRRMGDLDAAETELQQALPFLSNTVPLDRPGILASLAALRLAQGKPIEALSIAEDATHHADEMGACSRFFRDAFLALTHAECLQATGNHDGARARLLRAKQGLMLVADKIHDPAYRKSFLEQVPENQRILELVAQHAQAE